MNVFGIGLPEMVLVFVVALLVFGPKKLPEIGRTLGKTIRGFQDASKEFENEFRAEVSSIESAVQTTAKLEEQPRLNPAEDEIMADTGSIEVDDNAEVADEILVTQAEKVD